MGQRQGGTDLSPLSMNAEQRRIAHCTVVSRLEKCPSRAPTSFTYVKYCLAMSRLLCTAHAINEKKSLLDSVVQGRLMPVAYLRKQRDTMMLC